MKKVIIAGGGLAGLVTANILGRAGISCTVIEKKQYPFHRVCGEYISNEIKPFLLSLGLFPKEIIPAQITRLQLSSANGKSAKLQLDLGGFGISRHYFDEFLYQKAKSNGVDFLLNTEVESIHFNNNKFEIKTRSHELNGDVVIGAFGKRSKLDITLDRGFIHRRSPYIGVKYHIRTTRPSDQIELHNFRRGYCGISDIEGGKSCLCYLSHRSNLKEFPDIRMMERNVLFKNPFLKSIFSDSDFLFDRPETINEISFESKAVIEDHILMCGDAAGMIAPLCGNGMAIAIHSAKIVSELILEYCAGKVSRNELEKRYFSTWNARFATRLWVGRHLQKLFGGERSSHFAVTLARHASPVAQFLISYTHGKPL